jgi:hypothetical protein
MADDKVEGQEVDFLIQELSSAKPATAKATPAAAAVAAPAPARSTTRAVAPPVGVGSRTFVSAISVQSPADEGGIKERAIDWVKENVTDSIKERLALPALTTWTTGTTVVWTSLGLGVALGVAMPFWPYPKACAWWLLFYLFAVAVLVVAGVWAARLTWVTRLGVAHMLALGVVFWGITLAADETLPRIGYAKAEAAWFCR